MQPLTEKVVLRPTSVLCTKMKRIFLVLLLLSPTVLSIAISNGSARLPLPFDMVIRSLENQRKDLSYPFYLQVENRDSMNVVDVNHNFFDERILSRGRWSLVH